MVRGFSRNTLIGLAAAVGAALLLATAGTGARAEESAVAMTVEAPEGATLLYFDSIQELSAIARQVSHGNAVIDINNHRQTRLENSLNDNTGIYMVNQDAGNLANQANIRVITIGVSPGSVLVDLEVFAATQITHNTIEVVGGSRRNTLYNALGNVAGVFAINQSVGNLNNQLNLLTLSIGAQGEGTLVAVSDAWLARVRGENGITLDGVGPRTDYIGEAFGGFHGMGQVNQSAGDGNTIINSIAVSAQVVNLP